MKRESQMLAVIIFAFTTVTLAPMAAEPELVPTQKYDRFRNTTTLEVNLGQVYRGDNHDVRLELVVFYDGEGRRPGGSVKLHFLSNSKAGWVYREHHPLILLVDEERMPLELSHNGNVGKGYVLEYMWADLVAASWKKLAAATKIDGKLGLHEFLLTPKQLGALKSFKSLVQVSRILERSDKQAMRGWRMR